MKTIGLIAGNGRFPLWAAEQAAEEGYEVACCAIMEEADPAIEQKSRHTLWIKLGELDKVIRFFKKHGAEEALLAGKVTKVSLLKGQIRPDLEMIKALAHIRDWKDDSLLGAVVQHLEKKGIRILDSTRFLKNWMPQPGVLTKRKPSKNEWSDIEFGWTLAKEMGRLDVGQTVVVKSKAVLAVEAIEGTDEAIRRGGSFGKSDTVVVKVAKPRQDMRFDVPTIGLSTLKTMREAAASVLAVEAQKTIILDSKELIEFANRHKISIVIKENSRP